LTLRYLLLIGLPVSIGLFAISHKATVLLFGETFVVADRGMRILSWTAALSFAATAPSILLTASGRQKAKSIGVAVCLAANIAFNCFLIPKIGWEGAAWSRLIAEAMNLGIVVWLAAELFERFSWTKVVLKPLTSCILVCLVIKQLEAINIFGLIAIGIVTYFGSLTLLRGFSRDEVDWMIRILRRIALFTVREKEPELTEKKIP